MYPLTVYRHDLYTGVRVPKWTDNGHFFFEWYHAKAPIAHGSGPYRVNYEKHISLNIIVIIICLCVDRNRHIGRREHGGLRGRGRLHQSLQHGGVSHHAGQLSALRYTQYYFLLASDFFTGVEDSGL